MRLIDGDALKKNFPKDEDWEYPVNTNECVCECIDAQPTIDAIPIAWLEDLHKTAQSEEADRMIDEIISLWEARKNE